MEDAEQIKTALINQLREKMKFPSTSSVTTTTSIQLRLALCGNKKAERKTRKVELGQMNYQDSMYKQVRRATGGVTREIIAKKHETVSSMLERGKTLYFPGGTSMKEQIRGH